MARCLTNGDSRNRGDVKNAGEPISFPDGVSMACPSGDDLNIGVAICPGETISFANGLVDLARGEARYFPVGASLKIGVFCCSGVAVGKENVLESVTDSVPVSDAVSVPETSRKLEVTEGVSVEGGRVILFVSVRVGCPVLVDRGRVNVRLPDSVLLGIV